MVKLPRYARPNARRSSEACSTGPFGIFSVEGGDGGGVGRVDSLNVNDDERLATIEITDRSRCLALGVDVATFAAIYASNKLIMMSCRVAIFA